MCSAGSMYVLDNDGPSDKSVEGNTGGRSLVCKGNDAPFVGAEPGLEPLLRAVLRVVGPNS